MESEKALTPSEVADRLQVAKNTVYELIKRGDLRGYRVGNQVRVDEADLAAYRSGGRRIPDQDPRLTATYVAETSGSAPGEGTPFVLSGQDVVLDLLAHAVEAHPRGFPVLRSHTGSYSGLTGLYFGTVQAAAVHLWEPSTGRYNTDFIRALAPGIPTRVYRLVTRTVGWFVPRGNPKKIEGWEALGKPDLVFANREKGSGTRVLLDGKRLAGDGTVPRGWDLEYPSDLAAALAVGRGQADLALGTEKTGSLVPGLGFIPLQTEEYDLVVRNDPRNSLRAEVVAEVLGSGEFLGEVEALGGYGVTLLGTLREQ